jgi:hypothetical protein
LRLRLDLDRGDVLQGEEGGGLLLWTAAEVDEAAAGEGEGVRPQLGLGSEPLLHVQGSAEFFSLEKL